MTPILTPEARRDLQSRGFSRRHFAQIAAFAAAGASLPFYNEATLAQAVFKGTLPPDFVKIDANENPLGPCEDAAKAIHESVQLGGRYRFPETARFRDTLAKLESVPGDHVLPFAGSSDPLHRAVLAFAGPARSFIVADPGYEAGQRAAEYVGARVIKVPLKKDWSHDVHAMTQADPEAGLIYVCNPNNPTGSVTTKEDIDYLIANKPKNAIILIDEAYIHFSTTAEPATPHVKAGNDVIVLRTFSKLYGMAGLRAGACIARPDLLHKVSTGATSFLPTTGMVGATASLNAKDLIEQRRKSTADARTETAVWLTSKGFSVIPSEANMIMIDVKQPGRKFGQAMLQQKVAVGRVWPSMPNHVRVTIGTSQEMAKFREAFARVMNV